MLFRSVPPLSKETEEKVRSGAPEWMNVKNPLDVGPSGQYMQALMPLVMDPVVDMVLIIPVMPFATLRLFLDRGMTVKGFMGGLATLPDRAPEKPMVVCSIGDKGFLDDLNDAIGHKVPVISSPEMAARALAALYHYKEMRDKKLAE